MPYDSPITKEMLTLITDLRSIETYIQEYHVSMVSFQNAAKEYQDQAIKRLNDAAASKKILEEYVEQAIEKRKKLLEEIQKAMEVPKDPNQSILMPNEDQRMEIGREE